MTTKISQIEERADQAKKLAGEIAELNKAESLLLEQKANLTAELTMYAPSGFILDDKGSNGDAETDARLAQLGRINTKLDLLPGIRARLQADLDKIDRQLSFDCERALADARALAREQIQTLRDKFQKQLLPICGGDSNRAAVAVEAIVSQSEVHSWYEAFKGNVLLDGASVAARLLGLIKHVERFNAGEPIRAK